MFVNIILENRDGQSTLHWHVRTYSMFFSEICFSESKHKTCGAMES